MSASGLVVIKRYRPGNTDAVSKGAMRSEPPLNLTPSDVLLRYRGLDGEPWPSDFQETTVIEGLAPLVCLDAIEMRLRVLGVPSAYDLLYCTCVHDRKVELAPAGFNRLGFDYGFYRGEDETYSIVFHEILLGTEPGMRKLAPLLNEHLLLPDARAAEAVSAVRHDLVANGADFENAGETPRAFLLFGYDHKLRQSLP